MSIIETLVYDRTDEDVARWEELRQKGFASMTEEERVAWLAGMKGAYTPAIDMNRVGNAIAYLGDSLSGYGYIVNVDPKTDWTEQDIPTLEQLEEYLANVRTIREALPILPGTPHCPEDMDELTVEDANAIERILHNLEQVINAMRTALLRAGQVLLHSGGPAIYLLPAAQSGEPDNQTTYIRTANGLFVRTANGLYVTIGG